MKMNVTKIIVMKMNEDDGGEDECRCWLGR